MTVDAEPALDVAVRPATAGDFEALVDLDLASARHHVRLDPDLYHVPDRPTVAAFLARDLAGGPSTPEGSARS